MKSLYQTSVGIGLMLMAILAACSAQANPSQPADLAGSKWVLIQIENKSDGTITPAPALNAPTLEFNADGTIGGNGGCNSFGGEYQVGNGNTLALTNIVATLMACDNTPVETLYFNGLNGAQSFSVANDVLQITSSSGTVVLTFSKSA